VRPFARNEQCLDRPQARPCLLIGRAMVAAGFHRQPFLQRHVATPEFPLKRPRGPDQPVPNKRLHENAPNDGHGFDCPYKCPTINELGDEI